MLADESFLKCQRGSNSGSLLDILQLNETTDVDIQPIRHCYGLDKFKLLAETK